MSTVSQTATLAGGGAWANLINLALYQVGWFASGASAGQRGPLWWAAHHRLHHVHSDTPEDVHSLVPLLLGGSLFGLGALLERTAPGLGTSGPQMLIWGFFISTVVLFHGTCLINSMAHRFGRRRYATDDESRNSLLLALITLGEGWHNHHHHCQRTVRQGFFWWEIDVTYYLLRLMSWCGLIWRLTPVPEKARRSGLIADGAGR